MLGKSKQNCSASSAGRPLESSFYFAVIVAGFLILGLTRPAMAETVAELRNLSIDDLANIKVYSVSKSAQSLSDAPAAVYVITHDEIMRSGARTLPEILRLAPNLQVAQMSADSWAISARGFNGNVSNKLLVMIDGRSVYTPLYGGVLWDEKAVLPENIDRIEVISGPGATLWGANAVNGVINIITKKAHDTQGGVLAAGIGNREKEASIQYGGSLEDDLDYRVYWDGFRIAHGKTSLGANAEDGWSKMHTGFRLDWSPQSDTVSFHGDYYRGYENAGPSLHQNIGGGSFQLNWQHRLEDGSSLQVLAYYDGTRRFTTDLGYALNTYDLEFQHSFSTGSWNDIVWGAGYRAYQDRFNISNLLGTPLFDPPNRVVSLADVFGQDTLSLDRSLKLILGLKLEADPYSGISPLPNARLSWTLNDKTLLWLAVSRAVRAPTRFDEDLDDIISLLPPTFPVIPPLYISLTGNHDFKPEKLTAYEIGVRTQPLENFSFSVSAFYNRYNDLKSVDAVNETSLPFLWNFGNLMEGDIYGVEMWGNYQATDWWQLAAGFNLQHEDLGFEPGAPELGGTATAGDDPNHQASLRSTIDVCRNVIWEADLRHVGRLPDPLIPAYVELNSRLAWNATDFLQFSVSGFNLLHAHHLEYEQAGATFGNEVPRSFFVEIRWRI